MQQIASCDSADKRGGCTNPAIGKIVRKICCKTCFFVSTCNDNDAAVKTQSGGKEDSCASAVKAGGCTNAKYGHKVRFLCCKGCKKKVSSDPLAYLAKLDAAVGGEGRHGKVGHDGEHGEHSRHDG